MGKTNRHRVVGQGDGAMIDPGPIFAALRRSRRDHIQIAGFVHQEVRAYTTETRMDVSELKEQVHFWQQAANENAAHQLKASRRKEITNIVLAAVGVAVAGALVVDVMQQRQAFRATQAEINLMHGMLRGCVEWHPAALPRPKP